MTGRRYFGEVIGHHENRSVYSVVQDHIVSLQEVQSGYDRERQPAVLIGHHQNRAVYGISTACIPLENPLGSTSGSGGLTRHIGQLIGHHQNRCVYSIYDNCAGSGSQGSLGSVGSAVAGSIGSGGCIAEDWPSHTNCNWRDVPVSGASFAWFTSPSSTWVQNTYIAPRSYSSILSTPVVTHPLPVNFDVAGFAVHFSWTGRPDSFASSTIDYFMVQLTVAGVAVGAVKTVVVYPLMSGRVSLGGFGDLWGRSWLPTEVELLGVQVQVVLRTDTDPDNPTHVTITNDTGAGGSTGNHNSCHFLDVTVHACPIGSGSVGSVPLPGSTVESGSGGSQYGVRLCCTATPYPDTLWARVEYEGVLVADSWIALHRQQGENYWLSDPKVYHFRSNDDLGHDITIDKTLTYFLHEVRFTSGFYLCWWKFGTLECDLVRPASDHFIAPPFSWHKGDFLYYPMVDINGAPCPHPLNAYGGNGIVFNALAFKCMTDLFSAIIPEHWIPGIASIREAPPP